jgi:hypothetical protein
MAVRPSQIQFDRWLRNEPGRRRRCQAEEFALQRGPGLAISHPTFRMKQKLKLIRRINRRAAGLSGQWRVLRHQTAGHGQRVEQKGKKRDLALIVSEVPATARGCSRRTKFARRR